MSTTELDQETELAIAKFFDPANQRIAASDRLTGDEFTSVYLASVDLPRLNEVIQQINDDLALKIGLKTCNAVSFNELWVPAESLPEVIAIRQKLARQGYTVAKIFDGYLDSNPNKTIVVRGTKSKPYFADNKGNSKNLFDLFQKLSFDPIYAFAAYGTDLHVDFSLTKSNVNAADIFLRELSKRGNAECSAKLAIENDSHGEFTIFMGVENGPSISKRYREVSISELNEILVNFEAQIKGKL